MKVFPDLRYDLAIGHLVDGFDGNDVFAKVVSLKPFFQLALGLAGSKQQKRFSAANRRNHFIVVLVQMARKLPLVAIIGRRTLRFVRTRRTYTREASWLFFNIR